MSEAVIDDIEKEIDEKRESDINDPLTREIEEDQYTLIDSVLNFTPAIVILATVFSVFSLFMTEKNLVNKNDLKKDISALINNGAELRTVKFHYENRKKESAGFFKLFGGGKHEYYQYDTNLLFILEDIRTDQYMESDLAVDLVEKIDMIISHYTDTNPFDKLESGQKDLFENIRIKLGESYSLASEDIIKLSDELANKNKLVDEYLSNSKTSLFVSIGSAFLAVLLALVQMWQNRNKNSRKITTHIDQRKRPKEQHIINSDGTKKVRKIYPSGKVIERQYNNDGSILRKEYRES